jgi:ectoine hydroxylase-related dioxygenase (phytanoyl-CoA dioxygenase family)
VLIEGALSPDEIGRLDGAVDRVRGAEREDEDGPLHLLAFCGRDGAFLELLDHPRTMPLIVDTLGTIVFMYLCHLDVHPPETPGLARPWVWHQDGGIVNRDLEGSPRPRLSVKVAFFLTDVSEPGMGNLVVLPRLPSREPIDRPTTTTNDLPGSLPVLARAGDAVVFDRRVWHMRSPNLCGRTRKALFYAYTFRWVRARDDLDIRADLLPLITPVRAQLLGYGASSIDFWMPDRLELAGTGTFITTPRWTPTGLGWRAVGRSGGPGGRASPARCLNGIGSSL